MKISDFTWRVYRIPFRRPFTTAHGPLSLRTGALVSVRTDDGHVGHGEIAPLPSQSGASLDAALGALPGLARELRGRELADILRFLAVQSSSEKQDGDGQHRRYTLREGDARSGGPRGRTVMGQLPSALVCGLETALLDAAGQASGRSVAALLASGYPFAEDCESSAPRAHVLVNAVIGGETLEMAVTQAQIAVKAGFACLKLKVTGASEVESERVAAIRAAIGPEVSLRLDANEGWSFEQARSLLTRCAPYAIQYVEQPLPARDLAGMARLRRVSPIPLGADEALTGLESALRILDTEAADVLILKPQLAGGLLACREIIQQANQRNVACVITSTLEAGIGVAAALHLAAASPEVTMACGLATLALLEDDLLRDGLMIERGCMAVPRCPGLGVALNRKVLQHYL